jgi:hypothetical protein
MPQADTFAASTAEHFVQILTTNFKTITDFFSPARHFRMQNIVITVTATGIAGCADNCIL